MASLFIHLLVLAMARWGLTTAVRLFRMLSWARYSILTIAECMFGLLYGGWMFSALLKQHSHGPALLGTVIGASSAGLGLAWLAYSGQARQRSGLRRSFRANSRRTVALRHPR